MNSIFSNTAYRFSHAFLSDVIDHAKEQYSEMHIRFENAYQDAESTLGFSSTTFWLHDYTTMDLRLKEKARENEALGKCLSDDCPLRKMVNRYIAVMHHEVSVVAHCNGLPKELREMVVGWTLVGEDIKARKVRVRKWEVTACPCGALYRKGC